MALMGMIPSEAEVPMAALKPSYADCCTSTHVCCRQAAIVDAGRLLAHADAERGMVLNLLWHRWHQHDPKPRYQ